MWALAKRNLKTNTIKAARSGLAFLCRDLLPCPTESPYITMTMKAIQRARGTKTTSVWPLTSLMILDLFHITDFEDFLDTRNFLIILFAWLGLLRCGDMSGLLLDDVVLTNLDFTDKPSIPCVILYFDRTKTKSKSEGDVVCLASPPGVSAISPFQVTYRYIQLLKQKKPKAKYFFTQNSLSRDQLAYDSFNRIFNTQIKRIGYDPKLYSTHSGRIGGVTALVKLGVSELFIQKHGRWASTCWKGYFNHPGYASLEASTALLKTLNPKDSNLDFHNILRKDRFRRKRTKHKRDILQ